jgi:hypothetical protein
MKLRRIFGLKRDEVARGWRKLHNEELREFYSSPSIIRMDKVQTHSDSECYTPSSHPSRI